MTEEEPKVEWKVVYSVKEFEEALRDGWTEREVASIPVWVLCKGGEYVETEEGREEREAMEEGAEIIDVREVSPSEVKALVEQGWQVRTIYKGAVTMVLRKSAMEAKEHEET